MVMPERQHHSLASDQWNLAAHAPLSPDDLRADIERYRSHADREAGRRVVESHLRLVASMVWQHRGALSTTDDLMVEGALALCRALETFDPTRGVSFTSYAGVLIAFAVRTAAREQREQIRVPSRERRRCAAWRSAASRYFAVHGVWPSLGDLPGRAEEGLSRAAAQSTADQGTVSCLSLDVPDAGGGDHAGRVADHGPSPFERAAWRDDAARVSRVLGDLAPGPARVIRLYFGIGGESLTMTEVAARMRIARSAADLMLAEGLRALRAMFRREGARGGAGGPARPAPRMADQLHP